MPASQFAPSRNALVAIVDLLDEAYGDFSLNELATLLAVCEHEGLSVTSLARVCRFTEATASRTIRRLTPSDMPGALRPARGLLMLARAPSDNRSRYVFLTPQGRALCETFDALIGDSSRPRLSSRDPLSTSGCAPLEAAVPV
jgi:DNA-binding MarR family transcriptional regulator